MDTIHEQVRKFAALAETNDLIERVTIQRDDLDPEALTIIMQELLSRNISAETVSEYEKSRDKFLYDSQGKPRLCNICGRPAISSIKSWLKFLRIVPIMPITEYCCEAHTELIEKVREG